MVGADAIAYENNPTKTYSSPNAFPSQLRAKRALVQNTQTGGEAAKDRDPIVSLPPRTTAIMQMGKLIM
jgi:hypothetical protein